MNKSFVGLLLILVLSLSATSVFGQATPFVTIDTVEIDDVRVTEGATNLLRVERDQAVDVRVVVTGHETLDPADVNVRIHGYEHGDIAETSESFRLEANRTEVVDLSMRLPEDLEADDYSLIVEIAGKRKRETREFPLSIKADRHLLKIEDVLLRPSGTVRAGTAVFAVVRLENFGAKDEDNVRVQVSIPELGVSDNDFIDEIETDEQEETQELWLPIPRDAPEGSYTVETTVLYNDGHSPALRNSASINVVKAEVAKPVESMPPTTTPPVNGNDDQLNRVLTWVLIVLVVVVFIVGLIVFFTRMRSEE